MFLTISILGGWLDGHRGIAAALVLLGLFQKQGAEGEGGGGDGRA